VERAGVAGEPGRGVVLDAYRERKRIERRDVLRAILRRSGTLTAPETTALKKTCIALLLLGFLGGAAYAQQPTSPLLVHAVQCLASKKQVPTSPATALSYGYVVDTTAYPGKKVLFVVATPGSNHSAGRAFSIFFTERRHPIIDIQNGATFVRSNEGPGGVNFVSPPIGGTDAEGPFISAIQKVQGQSWFTIPASELVTPPAHTTCKSYKDNDQP
jgi:hypothetical protein